MPSKPRSPLHDRIGRRVRSLRQARGLTQAALAAQVGCSNHFISGIERGADSPSLITLEHLAAALGTTLEALVAEERSEHDRIYDELVAALRGKSDPKLMAVLREVASLYQPASPRRR